VFSTFLLNTQNPPLRKGQNPQGPETQSKTPDNTVIQHPLGRKQVSSQIYP